MQIGCGLFGVLKVRSKYKRLIYDGIRERFIFLTFRQEKETGCKSNLQPVLYLGRAEYIRDRIEYKTKCGRAAVSWACRDAPGRAGKDERHEAVGRSAAKSISQSRNPGDHGATAPQPAALGRKSVRLRPIGGPIQK